VSATGTTSRGERSDRSPGSVGGTASRAIDAVKEAAGEVKEEAASILDDAKATAEDALSRQKDLAADQISGFAQVLRTAADQLHEQQDGTIAGYATQAANALDRTSRALDEKDLSGLMHDVEDLGRRQPLLLFGGAMLTGFLLARFLKSSSTAAAAPREGPASPDYGVASHGGPGHHGASGGASDRGGPQSGIGNGGT
jgi:hypothetical protein